MRILKLLGKISSFIFATLLVMLITLFLTIKLFCNGKSSSTKELFVTTMLETGSLKWMASLFLSNNEIQDIVQKNFMEEMKNEINPEMITFNNKENDINQIELVEISGDTFFAKMLIIIILKV